MDQNLDKNIGFKENFINFLKEKKIFIIFLIIFALFLVITIMLYSDFQKKKGVKISEQYIKAGLLLAEGEKQESLNYYEKIILSKNKFYSLLSLNTILEKNLINDKEKVLKYFEELEKLKLSKEQNDLLNFKKALYLIKFGDKKKAEKILNNLINSKSNLKSLSIEIIN